MINVSLKRNTVARATVWLLVSSVLFVRIAQGGQAGTPPSKSVPSPGGLASPVSIDRPPPLEPPESVTQIVPDQVTVRAVRLTAPLQLDGQLDEAVYSSVRPMSHFIQTEPQEGVPATEKTEVWVFFDQDHVYVVARCWESQPDRMVVNEMRRDSPAVFQNETFGFYLDTFYDRRNGIGFNINPIGGRQDGQITNGLWNRDWNAIWDLAVGTFEGGWTVEVAVPFKSLRYNPGQAQVWGFNARRVNRWKNETSHLTPIPNALGGLGLFRGSLAATLVGIEAPPGSKNLEIKPYAISNLASDLAIKPSISNELSADVGIDVKYGVTQNLTADFTYNTDFAQVEADEQQVNLTRFSLLFPEKREFFLENPGLFAFGGVEGFTGGLGAGSAPLLFYSRRIGLNQGSVVPIELGGRLTGRVGRYSLGVLNIQTAAAANSKAQTTNFSVVRLKRDVLRRSNVGLIYTGRSVSLDGSGSNSAYGIDGTFAFFNNLAINTYWARTRTDGLQGKDTSYRAELDYAGDRYGVKLARLAIGDNFNPEVGFVQRDDMRRTAGELRFSPRPQSIELIRRFSWTGSLEYIENSAGRVDTREWLGEFAIEFQNSDRFNVSYGGIYEFLPRPFRIVSGVTLPVGGYDFSNLQAGFNFGTHRPVYGRLSVEHGTFYNGHKTAVVFSSGRANFTTQLSIEPTYSVNWVDLQEGSFTTTLAGSRVSYGMTPWMFMSALLQYNSGTNAMSANVRFRWEYQPGSELFVVYNEQRDTLARQFPELTNRALIVKVTRLFRF
jgi:hypothetical protein